jgi:hypothetical protein
MSVVRVPKALVMELRSILRDYPEINYLYEDEESIDSQLARALYTGMEDFNNVPPILNTEFSFENIPKRWVRPVLDLAVLRVLQEVSIWMARNEFEYQTGNTSVRLYNQWRSYQSLIPMLQAKVDQTVAGLKYKANVDQAWGANLTELYEAWRQIDPNTEWVVASS